MHQRIRRLVILAVIVQLSGCLALQRGTAPNESADRIEIGAYWGPVPDAERLVLGAGLLAGLGLGRSDRYGPIQFRGDLKFRLGASVERGRAYLSATPTAGMDLFPWSVVGFMIEAGLGPTVHYGDRSDLGLIFIGTVGWVFRFSSDPRHQVKLFISIGTGAFMRSSAHDFFENEPVSGELGISYEAPF